ncbi:uncharacterized protein BJX67DRAFT_100939 [Aspergillus lucknowensis]|uniref:Uncharacterized protein n=1 Tax=Aspergillus lucknowensis TaxID=176173 RepID=A0ABR4M6A1_9EURO
MLPAAERILSESHLPGELQWILYSALVLQNLRPPTTLRVRAWESLRIILPFVTARVSRTQTASPSPARLTTATQQIGVSSPTLPSLAWSSIFAVRLFASYFRPVVFGLSPLILRLVSHPIAASFTAAWEGGIPVAPRLSPNCPSPTLLPTLPAWPHDSSSWLVDTPPHIFSPRPFLY